MSDAPLSGRSVILLQEGPQLGRRWRPYSTFISWELRFRRLRIPERLPVIKRT
jgi:hypothetical protein